MMCNKIKYSLISWRQEDEFILIRSFNLILCLRFGHRLCIEGKSNLTCPKLSYQDSGVLMHTRWSTSLCSLTKSGCKFAYWFRSNQPMECIWLVGKVGVRRSPENLAIQVCEIIYSNDFRWTKSHASPIIWHHILYNRR